MSLADLADLPFCPGCTHEVIFHALARALEGSGVDPKRLVSVSDIGCHGIADRHLNIHTFHGLHGRSVTYASGMKLARPDLRAVVLIGDGGCGIGGHHLINAARRNVGLCVLVFNNFNFGMTGGQHSVTTPHGGRTTTTPAGNLERGFDLCALVQAAGATFVSRVTAFDPDLEKVLAAAISHDGFALVDIWGICTAYYMKKNEVRKAALIEAAKSMPGYGILRAERAPEYAASLPRGHGEEPRLDSLAISVSHRSPLDRRVEIVLAGSAGMRVRTAAGLLARAAVRSGLHVTQKDSFPVTVMKGFSVAELILSPERIDDLQVSVPDWLLIGSEDGWRKARRLAGASRRVWIDGAIASLDPSAVPLALEGIRKTELMLAMGAAALRGILPDEALRETIERDGREEGRERLVEAIERGWVAMERLGPAI